MTNTIQLPFGVTFLERGWLSSNNVLLQDAEQAILIDTGYWTHADQTLELVRSMLGEQPLDKIINTHLHSDHCGGNSSLQTSYPNVSTQIPPGHFEYVEHWNPEKLTYTPTGQHCPKFLVNSAIEGGQEFKVSGREWQAYAAPGHDPNSIILFCHEESILISADALWERGFGVVFPEIEGSSAFDEVEATIQLIESLKPRIVLPGHGSGFTDCESAITFARDRLQGFRNKPEKHAIYAAKVLLKFKLLELQAVEVNEFYEWANSCTYFHALHRYFKKPSFEAWTYEMCESLVQSGAAARNGNKLINI